jgi:hypothetical protein
MCLELVTGVVLANPRLHKHLGHSLVLQHWGVKTVPVHRIQNAYCITSNGKH